jgi:hypothetical protein
LSAKTVNHSIYLPQIAWARVLVDNQAIVLDIRTQPDVHPYMEEPERPLLTGFTALDLGSGEVLYEADMTRREDLHYIGWLCCPEYSALDPSPNVIICYPSSLYAVRFELERNVKKGLYLFNPNLTEVLVSAHVDYVLVDGRPQSVYGWNDQTWFKGWTARQALEHVCGLHGIDDASTESTVALLRRLVLHLAALDPIAIAPDDSPIRAGDEV